MRINSKLKNLSTKQVKKLTRIIVNWCFDHLGENKRLKKDLRIELDYDVDEKVYCGDYDRDEIECVLRIYMNMNVTVKDLISTILHEFCHHLQNFVKYDELYKKYGYKNHPYEKEARKIEERFVMVCWDDIRLKTDKII